MSGIAGIFGTKCDKEKMSIMVDKMRHRGIADYVDFSGQEDTFLNAHLSQNEKDCQPIYNEQDSICTVFSGQLYNYQELRQILKGKHRFSTDSDGELVLHLYEEKGAEFISLLDGIFAFAIYDVDKGLLLARDPLGIKPLYISDEGANIYFASEMKALVDVTSDFIEFPQGEYYQSGKGFSNAFSLSPDIASVTDMEEAEEEIYRYLKQGVNKRLVTEEPMGVYLSGGLDSSILAALMVQEMPGVDSFAVGMAGSGDLKHARLCADYLGTNHHEFVYDINDMLEVLPDVIYHLESYDAALVRSSVPNYLLARLASEEVNVVLSGEGADELFCGYPYLKELPEEELSQELIDVMGTLHNTGLQRGDRMSMAYGVEARVPFLDLDFIRYAFKIPISMKYGPDNQEKWVLRRAFSDILPEEIVYRKKDKFSVGAGSSTLLAQIAEEKISEAEFAQGLVTPSGHQIGNKEELMYYQIFREFYPEDAVDKAIGFSRSL